MSKTCCSKPDFEEVTGGHACINCGILKENTFQDEQTIYNSTATSTSGFQRFSFYNKNENLMLASQNASHAAKLLIQHDQSAHLQVSQSMKTYMRRIRVLSENCKLSKEMCKRSQDLFDLAYPKYRYKPVSSKMLLCAVCVYTALLEQGQLVSAQEFCKKNLDVELKTFLSAYQDTKSILKQQIKPQILENVVLSIFKPLPNSTPEQDRQHSTMVKKTLVLYDLAEKAWLVTGRSQSAMITACAFFAWKSMGNKSFKNNFNRFYDEFQFTSQKSTAILRKTELENLLVKLAQCLPLVKAIEREVTKNNVVYYINEVLEMKDKLLQRYLKSVKHNVGDVDVEKHSTEVSPPFTSMKSDEIAVLDESNACAESQNEVPVVQRDHASDRINFSEFRKKQKPRKRRYRDDSDSECEHIPSDEDVIPESDWHMYLKSEDEIRSTIAIRNWVKQTAEQNAKKLRDNTSD